MAGHVMVDDEWEAGGEVQWGADRGLWDGRVDGGRSRRGATPSREALQRAANASLRAPRWSAHDGIVYDLHCQIRQLGEIQSVTDSTQTKSSHFSPLAARTPMGSP